MKNYYLGDHRKLKDDMRDVWITADAPDMGAINCRDTPKGERESLGWECRKAENNEL